MAAKRATALSLQALGNRLDRAESVASKSLAHFEAARKAQAEYVAGLYDFNLEILKPLASQPWNGKRNDNEKLPSLYANAVAASEKLSVLRGACSARTYANAKAAQSVAWHTYKLVRNRAEHFRRQNMTSPVTRKTTGPMRSRRRHPIVDGYIKTGKTILVDGIRVPIVRQVKGLQNG